MRPSLFSYAGGEPAFLALATAHHARCLADPELNHPFSHADQNPQHVERLAAYWAEVMGGPAKYSGSMSDQGAMLHLHAGNGDMSDLGRRFVECFLLAADDADLPADPEFRGALRAYMEWAVDDVLSHTDDVAPSQAHMPHWTWDGPALVTDTEFVWRKWDGSRHWAYEMTHLGSDEHGDWFGQRAGAHGSRPGVDIVMSADHVALVPGSGGWVATFYEPPHEDHILTYIDVAAQVAYDPAAGVVSAIDMDLDVVKSDDECGVWIDDEDEFEERTISMAYPRVEVEAATRTAGDLAVAVRSSAPPFDGRHEHWMRRLASK